MQNIKEIDSWGRKTTNNDQVKPMTSLRYLNSGTFEHLYERKEEGWTLHTT